MITSLKFQDFRIFPSLEMAPLQRVNLIAGANNTGKTGILEGLYLLFVNDAGQLGLLPSVFRSIVSGVPNQITSEDFATFWQTLFYDRQTEVPARISVKSQENKDMVCKLKVDQKGEIQLFYEQFDETVQRRISHSIQQAVRQPSFIVRSNGSAGGVDVPNPFATQFIVFSTRLEHPTRDADLYNQLVQCRRKDFTNMASPCHP
jgi:predicted ATPase